MLTMEGVDGERDALDVDAAFRQSDERSRKSTRIAPHQIRRVTAGGIREGIRGK